MQARLDRMPDAMLVRRQTVEHPYGTIKAWMGSTHFFLMGKGVPMLWQGEFTYSFRSAEIPVAPRSRSF